MQKRAESGPRLVRMSEREAGPATGPADERSASGRSAKKPGRCRDCVPASVAVRSDRSAGLVPDRVTRATGPGVGMNRRRGPRLSEHAHCFPEAPLPSCFGKQGATLSAGAVGVGGLVRGRPAGDVPASLARRVRRERTATGMRTCVRRLARSRKRGRPCREAAARAARPLSRTGARDKARADAAERDGLRRVGVLMSGLVLVCGLGLVFGSVFCCSWFARTYHGAAQRRPQVRASVAQPKRPPRALTKKRAAVPLRAAAWRWLCSDTRPHWCTASCEAGIPANTCSRKHGLTTAVPRKAGTVRAGEPAQPVTA